MTEWPDASAKDGDCRWCDPPFLDEQERSRIESTLATSKEPLKHRLEHGSTVAQARSATHSPTRKDQTPEPMDSGKHRERNVVERCSDGSRNVGE